MKEDLNQEKNRLHFEKLYTNYPIKNILYWINNLEKFLDSATSTELSWYALYQNDFRKQIKGKKVLEMGCGDCVNAAIMAAMGAEVYANDIADSSGKIIEAVNEAYSFKYPITYISGDFLQNGLSGNEFDFVVGKAFLHHLEIPLEKKFLKETARLLKQNGEARFFEPAVNSKILDEIRWYIPIKDRPSKLRRRAFKEWKENDPHPERSFSSAHFERAGKEFFKEVKTIPVGTLERFGKLMKWGGRRNSYKKWALRTEKKIPEALNKLFARSQLIIYRKPY